MTEKVTNSQLLSVAKKAAYAAGEQVRDMFGKPLQINSKGPRDVVTEADLAAQGIITSMILEAFPDHAILPEEENPDLPTDGPILWVIDPIDGTVNYSRGVPNFCVSIAAVENSPPLTVDNILAGVVYDPMLDEMFTATAGGPALLEERGLHGRPLQTSSVDSLHNALVGLDWPLQEDLRQLVLDYINGLAHDINVFRSLGSATLSMAWVADGRLDGYINFQLKAWDVAAAALIVKQAGGSVTDIEGNPIVLDPAGLNCLLSNKHLAGKLVIK